MTGLGERGLGCPLLVISDGAPGLVGAVQRTMGAALRQRCLIHRCRNVLAKVSKNAQAAVKADYWAIFEVPEDMAPGLDAVAYVQKRIDSFAARWRDSYPAAVHALLADRESLTVYLRFPREHWTRVRHSNFIERTFAVRVSTVALHHFLKKYGLDRASRAAAFATTTAAAEPPASSPALIIPAEPVAAVPPGQPVPLPAPPFSSHRRNTRAPSCCCPRP